MSAVFAVAVGLLSAEPVQRAWGVWAAVGYAVAALAAAWRGWGRNLALAAALAGGLAAPLTWMAATGHGISMMGEGSLVVVARSGWLLARNGSPYLPAAQLSHVLAYDPYEPLMAVFGLPAAAGLPGAAGNPRLWFGLAGAAALSLAFHLARRGSALRATAFAFGSPVLALPLTVGGTDVPVLALLCLALAWALAPGAAGKRAACTGGRGRAAGRRPDGVAPECGPGGAWPRLLPPAVLAGIAIGLACAIKATAWPAVPVIAALFAARDGARAALRFVAATVAAGAAGAAAAAPTALTRPRALLQNTVAFPLGLARHRTPAASPLPGHLLATTGHAGHIAAIALLAAAFLAVAVSLVARPPRTVAAAVVRLAVAMALLFLLAPDARFGYFAYPAGLCGWLWLARPQGRRLASPGG